MSNIVLKTAKRKTTVPRSRVRAVVSAAFASKAAVKIVHKKNMQPTIVVSKVKPLSTI